MDSPKEVLMKNWNDKGCKSCRGLWEKGKLPRQISINTQRHATLYRCSECGSYWEEHERFSDIISPEDAKKYYPDMSDECKTYRN